MNIFKARKSGKRYKRKHWKDWYSNDEHESHSSENVDADDYILEPNTKPEKKKVKVYRPIFKEGSMFKMGDYWSESKKKPIPEHCDVVGWEEKEIEVTE